MCRRCARTALISAGRLVRRGPIGACVGALVASVVLVAALLWPGVAAAELPRISMRVRACERDNCSKPVAVSFSASTSRHVVELRVARHEQNRRLIVTLYCDGLVIDGPAEMPHEGDAAFPVRTREYRRLAPGEYVATAVLVTATGEQFRAAPAQFTILEGLP